MVMQPPDCGHHDSLPAVWRLDGPRRWTVHRQSQMGSPGMVIGTGACQQALQMPLVQADAMVEALAPDAPDEALHIRMLPRTAGRHHDLFAAHLLHPLPKPRAVATIAVAP